MDISYFHPVSPHKGELLAEYRWVPNTEADAHSSRARGQGAGGGGDRRRRSGPGDALRSDRKRRAARPNVPRNSHTVRKKVPGLSISADAIRRLYKTPGVQHVPNERTRR